MKRVLYYFVKENHRRTKHEYINHYNVLIYLLFSSYTVKGDMGVENLYNRMIEITFELPERRVFVCRQQTANTSRTRNGFGVTTTSLN